MLFATLNILKNVNKLFLAPELYKTSCEYSPDYFYSTVSYLIKDKIITEEKLTW